MYPDHCVYLGPAAATLRAGESIEDALSRYGSQYDYNPGFLLVEGKGVLVESSLKLAGRELLVCLKRVIERIPTYVPDRYLNPAQVARLMNWDAEKYRISLAEQRG